MDHTYFEQVPLEEIRHIIEKQGSAEPIPATNGGLFSVRFAWAESHRFFYEVSLIDVAK